VSLPPSSAGKPTAQRAIKSFSGGPGGRFFKKAPLAAGVNNKIDSGLNILYNGTMIKKECSFTFCLFSGKSYFFLIRYLNRFNGL
jgi:hypothetical protein